MHLSERIIGLTGGGSDGWDIYRKARALKSEGVAVVELTIGEHDRRTEPEILDAMYAAARGGHTGYPALPGTDGLRTTVAARVADRTGSSRPISPPATRATRRSSSTPITPPTPAPSGARAPSPHPCSPARKMASNPTPPTSRP